MKLTESQIIAKWQDFLTEVDTDELARLTGKIFGGKCTCYFDPDESWDGEMQYEFKPNKNYCGAFGDEIK